MTPRQTVWPRTWLMTHERMGDRLWEAIERLPPGSGIVFRHYSLSPEDRRELAERIAAHCRTGNLILAVAADEDLACRIDADLVHNPRRPTDLPFSRAVHTLEDAKAAERDGAALVFVSPVFATRSHPATLPLDPDLARNIANAAKVPAIALGGMNASRFAQLDGFYGWAGIDAWLGDGGA